MSLQKIFAEPEPELQQEWKLPFSVIYMGFGKQFYCKKTWTSKHEL
jgi:hypothetical protein